MTLTNPFADGITELIDRDEEFANLFEPSILDRIAWHKHMTAPLTYWLSAQGGGKSAILRAFTPGVLQTARRREPTDALRQTLERIGALRNGQPAIIGIHSKCTVSFSYIGDLSVSPARQQALFFALINTRVILRFLRALCTFHDVAPTDGLEKFAFEFSEDFQGLSSSTPRSGTGRALHDWASRAERACLETIENTGDSAQPDTSSQSFVAQRICDPRYWKFNDQPVDAKAIILLDDAQTLTDNQRAWLAKSITEEREGARVWMAARLHVMDRAAIFIGAREKRDWEEVRLEDLWRTKGEDDAKPSKGNAGNQAQITFLTNIGNKRISRGASRRIKHFSDLVQDQVSFPAMNVHVAQAIERIKKRIQNKTRGGQRFSKWLTWPEQATTPWDVMLRWRALEILIERDMNAVALNIEEVLDISVLEVRGVTDGGVTHAALALISAESKGEKQLPDIPLYYGIDTLAYLGMENVQQFIRTCRILYDKALDQEIRRNPQIHVDAADQDRLIRSLATERWRAIHDDTTDGDDIQRLLDVMIQRMRVEFDKPNAPYAPSPVGLGIPQEEYEALMDKTVAPELEKVANLLGKAVAFNLLAVQSRHHRSVPHKIFFVNPLVLVHQGLPIRSRQFQGTTLEELASWLENGFEAPEAGGWSQANRKRIMRGPKMPSSRGSRRLNEFEGEDNDA